MIDIDGKSTHECVYEIYIYVLMINKKKNGCIHFIKFF
jgi:hypothetical protein